MKNGEALKLLEDLKKVYNVRGDKFTYALKRNVEKLQALDKSIRDRVPKVPEYFAYQKLMGMIEMNYRKKIVNSKLNEEDQKAKNDDIIELETKYADAITKFQESEEFWYKLLDEEVENFSFYMISREVAEAVEPKLTGEQRVIIAPFEVDEEVK